MVDLIKTAQQSGLTAKYVLFDSWFTSPKTIVTLKQERKLDIIAMVKKSSKVKYAYQGEMLDIKKIYSKNKKRRGRSKYLLSIEVTVGKEAIPAKIVCVRNKSKKKDCLDDVLYELRTVGFDTFPFLCGSDTFIGDRFAWLLPPCFSTGTPNI